MGQLWDLAKMKTEHSDLFKDAGLDRSSNFLEAAIRSNYCKDQQRGKSGLAQTSWHIQAPLDQA